MTPKINASHMQIEQLLLSEEIQHIEREILYAFYMFEKKGRMTDCFPYLLRLRKDLINTKMLSHQEDLLPELIEFNESLRHALQEMFDRAHYIWNNSQRLYNANDEVELTAKCYLGWSYPSIHPLQRKDRETLWSAICDGGWNSSYTNGASLQVLKLPEDGEETFEEFLGMDRLPSPNWNEGLDSELTKDLHLITQFHNLFEHTSFAITDFIYVRDFEIEINIEIDHRTL